MDKTWKRSSYSAHSTELQTGALYAGGVLGLSKTLKDLKDLDGKKLTIITVGLADTGDLENAANIRNGIRRQLPEGVFSKAAIFHLRGGIDCTKLNLKHRTMMRLLYEKARHLPEEKTTEVRAMIDTYHQKVDFVDLSGLDEIVRDMI